MTLNDIANVVDDIDAVDPDEITDPLLYTSGGVYAWNVVLDYCIVNSEESEAETPEQLKKELLNNLDALSDRIKNVVERARKGE